jgi:hypothetical protein
MTCTPGSDFNDASAKAMIDEWNDFLLLSRSCTCSKRFTRWR